MEGFVTR